MGFFDFLKPKSAKETVIKKYYSKYPEEPYIRDDRDFQAWEQLISFDPRKLVSKDKMVRNTDGLLPGHVYQIYWIDKYNSNKRVPVYFEYEFGINFEEEKVFLEKNGFIVNDKATAKGKTILAKYRSIIDTKNNQNKPPKLNMKKELAKFDKQQKELTKLGIESHEDRNEKKGFIIQNNAIVDYKNSDFESAKKGFLEAINKYDFYSPGGVEYLAKIYRKEKDYQSEINIIEKALDFFESQPDQNWSKPVTERLRKRLDKAQALLNK